MESWWRPWCGGGGVPSHNPAMTPDLMSPPELADYLGVSRNTVYALLAAGQVPGAVRFGRRWRISRPALEHAVHGPARGTR